MLVQGALASIVTVCHATSVAACNCYSLSYYFSSNTTRLQHHLGRPQPLQGSIITTTNTQPLAHACSLLLHLCCQLERVRHWRFHALHLLHAQRCVCDSGAVEGLHDGDDACNTGPGGYDEPSTVEGGGQDEADVGGSGDDEHGDAGVATLQLACSVNVAAVGGVR